MNAKRAILVAVLPLTAACSWLTDFRQQPSVGPWQSTSVSWADTSTPSRGAPQGSVPTVGTAVASYQISYGKTLATIDSFSTIPNPIPPTQESVDRGWKYFQTNCAACHGNEGASSTLALSFGIAAPSLVQPVTVARTDGYIFGMIRNGRNNMPTMNRIDERDRWNVINYLRGLQGKLPPNIVIRKVPPGRPGVTGDSLPGETRLGPTRLVPAAKPAYTPTPGKSGEAGRGGQP